MVIYSRNRILLLLQIVHIFFTDAFCYLKLQAMYEINSIDDIKALSAKELNALLKRHGKSATGSRKRTSFGFRAVGN